MKSNGITLASSPQSGSVAITYDELEASNARRFIAVHINVEAPEYDGDFDGEELPESIMAAAIAFKKALQVLHFVPEMSVQWLIDNVPGVCDETVRRYAEQALGLERIDVPPGRGPASVSAVKRMIGKMSLEDAAQLEAAVTARIDDLRSVSA